MPERRISRRVIGATAITAAAGGVVMLLPQDAVYSDAVAAPLPQATTVSPQGTPTSPQPTPAQRQLRFYPVEPVFANYYIQVDGPRVLGQAISAATTSGGVPAQYFEKARLEDSRSRNRTDDPSYNFEYGLLVDEMKAVRSQRPVGGELSTVSYDTIQTQSDPSLRVQPPANFRAGDALVLPDGSAFIPFTADLSAGPGHNVPRFFWDFINRDDLFPGGFLHDIGLPITPALEARVDKGRIIGTQITRVTDAPITIQAFQRTILTYDPSNPEGFLTERANTGTDYFSVFPDRFPL